MTTERKSILWTESKGCALLPFLLFLSLLFFTLKTEPYGGPLLNELDKLIELNKAVIEQAIGTTRNKDYTSTHFDNIEQQGFGTCTVLLRGSKGKARLIVKCKYKDERWLFFDAYIEHIEPKSNHKTPLTTGSP